MADHMSVRNEWPCQHLLTDGAPGLDDQVFQPTPLLLIYTHDRPEQDRDRASLCYLLGSHILSDLFRDLLTRFDQCIASASSYGPPQNRAAACQPGQLELFRERLVAGPDRALSTFASIIVPQLEAVLRRVRVRDFGDVSRIHALAMRHRRALELDTMGDDPDDLIEFSSNVVFDIASLRLTPFVYRPAPPEIDFNTLYVAHAEFTLTGPQASQEDFALLQPQWRLRTSLIQFTWQDWK
jgi:hypothetical protein